MRNNKIIMPLFLVFILLGSVFCAISSRQDAFEKYSNALEAARDYAQKGVYLDAITEYESAISQSPSVEISYEAGMVILESGDVYSARSWYKSMLAQYPTEPKTYLYGIVVYNTEQQYSAAFEVYDAYQSRGLFDPEVEKVVDEFRYSYKLTNRFDDVAPYSNVAGLAAVKYQGAWGYANQSGEKKIGYLYEKAGTFSEFAPVVDMEGNAYYIDTSGNIKITEDFILEKDPDFGCVREFGPYQGNAIWAYNGSIWNAYDIYSFEKLCGGFTEALPFSNEIAAVSNGEKWALISSTGVLITEHIYDEVLSDGKQNICRANALLVRIDDSYFLIDRNGNRISEDSYTDACAFYDNTFAAVKRNDKWCFVDETGAVVLETDYESATSFSAGFAAVKKNGKWGYIGLDGEEVIDFCFDDTEPFSLYGNAFVYTEDGHWKILKLYMYNHD